jgi:hypothetical protein
VLQPPSGSYSSELFEEEVSNEAEEATGVSEPDETQEDEEEDEDDPHVRIANGFRGGLVQCALNMDRI